MLPCVPLHYQRVRCAKLQSTYQVARGGGLGGNALSHITDIVCKGLAGDDWAALHDWDPADNTAARWDQRE